MIVALVPGLTGLLSGCQPRDPGARVFAVKCAGCHGKDGSGDRAYKVGRPYTDLTDGLWKHGGDLSSVRRAISEGPEKSPMPAFRGRLSETEIDAVASHVLTLSRGPAAGGKGGG